MFFAFEDTKVAWRDAVVAWTMFYREAPSIDFLAADSKGDVRGLLKRVRNSGYGSLRYFRWDWQNRQYKTFPARDPSG